MDIINRYFRIGYFNIRGYSKFNIDELNEDFIKPELMNYEAIKAAKESCHLDVRSKPEWKNDGILDGAITIPLGELEERWS